MGLTLARSIGLRFEMHKFDLLRELDLIENKLVSTRLHQLLSKALSDAATNPQAPLFDGKKVMEILIVSKSNYDALAQNAETSKLLSNIMMLQDVYSIEKVAQLVAWLSQPKALTAFFQFPPVIELYFCHAQIIHLKALCHTQLIEESLASCWRRSRFAGWWRGAFFWLRGTGRRRQRPRAGHPGFMWR